MLSAEARAGVAEAAEDWAAAEATPGGTEVMGILDPAQACPEAVEGQASGRQDEKNLEKLEESVSNSDMGPFGGVNESTLRRRTLQKNKKVVVKCFSPFL